MWLLTAANTFPLGWGAKDGCRAVVCFGSVFGGVEVMVGMVWSLSKWLRFDDIIVGRHSELLGNPLLNPMSAPT